MSAIFEGKLDHAGLTAAERALMDYVKIITEAALSFHNGGRTEAA